MKTKNLLTPTPAQVKHRNRLWANALVENERKTRNQMYCKGGRCCLAVAQDVAAAHGLANFRGHDEGMPHPHVAKFFGWSHVDPPLIVNFKHGERFTDASNINDGCPVFDGKKDRKYGITHKQIAECVLNTFVRPSKKEWSFTA